jgi:hypothetical protein
MTLQADVLPPPERPGAPDTAGPSGLPVYADARLPEAFVADARLADWMLRNLSR